jgi:hypothetical protein
MPLAKLPMDHIGVAVEDIQVATERYKNLLGAEIEHDEEVLSQQVRVRFLKYGDAPKIELLEALNENSPVEEAFDEITKSGLQIIQDHPIRGAANKLIFFIHPKSMGGSLIEICQPIN